MPHSPLPATSISYLILISIFIIITTASQLSSTTDQIDADLSLSSMSEWEQKYFHIWNTSSLERYMAYLPEHLFSTPEFIKCNATITEWISRKDKKIYDIVSYSYKTFPDFGKELDCVNHNYTYFLVIVSYPEIYKSITKRNPWNQFLRKPISYFGICSIEECTSNFQTFLGDETLHERMKNGKEIEIKYYMHSNNTSPWYPWNDTNENGYYIFIISIVLFWAYFIFRLGISIIGNIYFHGEEHTKNPNSASTSSLIDNTAKDDDDNNFEIKHNEIEERLYDNSDETETDFNYYLEGSRNNFQNFCETYQKHKTEKTVKWKKPHKEVFIKVQIKKIEPKKSELHPKCYFVYNTFNFSYNLGILFSKNNQYYNENGLNLINFFQAFTIFWMTFNHNMWTWITIPSREIENELFFRQFWISFVKYSIFSMTFWVALQAMTLAYKLMSLIKNYQIKHPNTRYVPWKEFFWFYISFLPKIMTFFTVFLFMHILVKYWHMAITPTTMFRYFLEDIIYCRLCWQNPDWLKNPISMQYSDFLPLSAQQRSFKNCFKFFVISINEFFSFSFIIILTYISLRFKSRIFDAVFLVLYVINTSLSYLSSRSFINEFYTFRVFMGDVNSWKYLHLFINLYLTGFFTGLAYFYYKDIISTNSMETHGMYKPFNFCYTFISGLDRLSKLSKTALLCLTILIQVGFSSMFYLYINFYETQNGDGINWKVNALMNVVDWMETKVVVIIFCWMILLILVYPKDTLFKYWYETSAFVPWTRTGYAYFCTMDNIIYLFYCLYGLQVQLDYLNIFCVTIGWIIWSCFINVWTVVWVELPVRMLIKRLKGSDKVEAEKQE